MPSDAVDGRFGHASERRADPILGTAAWTAVGGESQAHFGYGLAPAGDVNGDGYADVVVGADGAGDHDAGRAYTYLGSSTGLPPDSAWVTEADSPYSYLGAAVAAAGDVNGDGFGDVVIGSPEYSGVGDGRALVYLGSAAGLGAAPAWTGTAPNDQDYGVEVASAGDVNGDGYDDLVVSSRGRTIWHEAVSRARVYLGGPGGLAADAAWETESGLPLRDSRYAVASAGDVNGDGYDDLVIGSDGERHREAREGRALLYLGSAAGLQPGAAWTAEGDQPGARFGIAVAGAGDVDGDGYDDVLIGAVFYDGVQRDEGRVYLYRGSAAGLATTPAWTAEADVEGASFGACVSGAGDVDGDGYDDVLVGAAAYSGGEDREGQVYLYLGSRHGLARVPAWTMEADQRSAILCRVATAGDLDGDGYDDVLVGAYAYDETLSDEGKVWAFHGSSGVSSGDTGAKSDTGGTARVTGDTASRAESGETAESADTAESVDTVERDDTAASSPADPGADPGSDRPGGCGCASTGLAAPSWIGVLLVAPGRRRGGGPPTTPTAPRPPGRRGSAGRG